MNHLSEVEVEKLKACLTKLEQALSIKIIYASVIGSRAFGNASSDSDYDLRFVYVQLPWARRLAVLQTTLPDTDSTIRDNDTITIDGRLFEVDIFGIEVLRHMNKLTASSTLDVELVYSPLVVLDTGYGEDLRSIAGNFLNKSSMAASLRMQSIGAVDERKLLARGNLIKNRRKVSLTSFRLALTSILVEREGFSQDTFNVFTRFNDLDPVFDGMHEALRNVKVDFNSEDCVGKMFTLLTEHLPRIAVSDEADTDFGPAIDTAQNLYVLIVTEQTIAAVKEL